MVASSGTSVAHIHSVKNSHAGSEPVEVDSSPVEDDGSIDVESGVLELEPVLIPAVVDEDVVVEGAEVAPVSADSVSAPSVSVSVSVSPLPDEN